MPELPEVTIFMLLLQQNKKFVGSSFQKVTNFDPAMIELPLHDAESFSQELIGKEVRKIDRRGKYLLLTLNHGYTLILHLRLTGGLVFRVADEPYGEFTSFAFEMSSGIRLDFDDVRRFGKAWLTKEPEKVLAKLGVEPFGKEMTAEYLFSKFGKKRKAIKTALLEQDIVAGIGNIYADEVLFRWKIHPLTKASTISLEQWTDFIPLLRELFSESIEYKGTSFDQVYTLGHFQKRLNVYSREEKPCLICQTPIERIVLGGRTTSFCPHCQPLDEEKAAVVRKKEKQT